jgi:hypothetical protein
VQHPVRSFVAALLRYWRALISCVAFTILGVYALTNKGNVWLVGGSTFLAAVFFAVAAYHAWRREYDKYSGESERYQKPDISGEAFNFRGYRVRGDDQSRSRWSSSQEVTFDVFLCNHSPINTTLKSIELDGTRLTPALLFHVVGAGSGGVPFPVGLEMPHGRGKQFTVHVTATVGGMGIRQTPPIAMDNLAIHILDAFEQKHPIRIRLAERLIFGER